MLRTTEAVCHQPVEDVLRAVFEAADQFTGKAPHHDDMTLLSLKIWRLALPPKRGRTRLASSPAAQKMVKA